MVGSPLPSESIRRLENGQAPECQEQAKHAQVDPTSGRTADRRATTCGISAHRSAAVDHRSADVWCGARAAQADGTHPSASASMKHGFSVPSWRPGRRWPTRGPRATRWTGVEYLIAVLLKRLCPSISNIDLAPDVPVHYAGVGGAMPYPPRAGSGPAASTNRVRPPAVLPFSAPSATRWVADEHYRDLAGPWAMRYNTALNPVCGVGVGIHKDPGWWSCQQRQRRNRWTGRSSNRNGNSVRKGCHQAAMCLAMISKRYSSANR
jgi:hypothetical protein